MGHCTYKGSAPCGEGRIRVPECWRGQGGGGPQAIPPAPNSGSQRVNRKSAPRPPITDLSGRGEGSPQPLPSSLHSKGWGIPRARRCNDGRAPLPKSYTLGPRRRLLLSFRIPSPVGVREDPQPSPQQTPSKSPAGFIRTTQPSPIPHGPPNTLIYTDALV